MYLCPLLSKHRPFLITRAGRMIAKSVCSLVWTVQAKALPFNALLRKNCRIAIKVWLSWPNPKLTGATQFYVTMHLIFHNKLLCDFLHFLYHSICYCYIAVFGKDTEEGACKGPAVYLCGKQGGLTSAKLDKFPIPLV